MFALLAFKRPSLIEGRYQLAFEIRSFGCFNGFNTPNAFTTMPEHGGSNRFDVLFDNVMENGALPPNYFFGGVAPTGMYTLANQRPKSELNFDNVAVHGGPGSDLLTSSYNEEGRPWECIGIGYMCFAVGQCMLNYQAPAIRNPNYPSAGTREWINPQWDGHFVPSTNAYSMPSRVMALVNRNRINSTYYNHQSGDTMTSHREATLNEKFLQSFLASMDDRNNTPTEVRYSLKSSRMILAISYAMDYMHSTFDLVGSERPSGLAISYLQTYRNVCEKCWGGMNDTEVNKASASCLNGLYKDWPFNDLDPIPLMSYVCNNGDDSDILAFCGQNFTMYATKVGLFNCDKLFRRSDSMLVEGRYNKGGQSGYIMSETNGKVGSRDEAVKVKFRAACDAVEALRRYHNHMIKMPSVAGLAALMDQYVTTINSRREYNQEQRNGLIAIKAEEQAAQLQGWLTTHGSFQLGDIVVKLRRSASALTNFQQPYKSKLELNPNPMGFRDWILQAEGATAEGTQGESTEIPSALPTGGPTGGDTGVQDGVGATGTEQPIPAARVGRPRTRTAAR